METYYDSAENQRVTLRQVSRMLIDHGHVTDDGACDPEQIEQFIADNGIRATYDAQHVLRWLGY